MENKKLSVVIDWIKNLFKGNNKKPNLKKFRNRSLTKAKILFIYIIGAAIVSALYAVSCLFTGFSYWYAVIPYSLLFVYLIGLFLYKNWRMILVFLQSTERGRLLMFLNDSTHWQYTHKMRVVEWVYLRRNYIRNEQRLKLNNMVMEGEKLSDYEKKEMKKKVVICPQQLLDGFNKAILVNALIYAHRNIQVLDDEIRDILELTDEHMDAFNMNEEIAKCMVKK